jgi:hypothetical protein
MLEMESGIGLKWGLLAGVLGGSLKGWGLDLGIGWNDWRFDGGLRVRMEIWIGDLELRVGVKVD